ncbi:MAG: polysaccharide deacetylase family protein [Gammaproteobacteria bacterium]|nr:polysaccharide deacetylase family protein [Gammaproteobacteria bacterium]
MIKAKTNPPPRPALLSVLLLASALALWPPPAPAAVVLMYHHFGDQRYPTTNIRLTQFEAQLDEIAARHYQVWPLQRIVDRLLAQQPLPDDVVALTIDDAFVSVYTEAWPRLKKRRWPFTVFVSTDDVDRHLPAFMSWDQMRAMQHDGASFANHAQFHESLATARAGEDEQHWLARVRASLQHAQQRLTTELGTAPLLFSYPYGEYSTTVAALVRELGLVAFGQHSGVIDLHADLRALPRFAMSEHYADLAQFRDKLRGRTLPVSAIEPWEPVTREARPTLRITLADVPLRRDELRCFVNGGPVTIRWLDRTQQQFIMQASRPLPAGRSRYNCTAPAGDGRYYWFSQPWLRR